MIDHKPDSGRSSSTTDAETREESRIGQHDRLGKEDRSLTDLIRELRDESSHLLRQEVALAKAEVSEKAAVYGRNAGYLVAGAAIASASVIFLALAATVGIYNGLVAAELSRATSGWPAPLITGLVFCGIGYALVQKALNTLRHESPVPERTVDSMQENTQWMKEKVKQ